MILELDGAKKGQTFPPAPVKPAEMVPAEVLVVPKPSATNHRDREASVLQNIRVEMAGYYAEMKTFRSQPVGEIFLLLAGWTARMSEIRSQLVQKESTRAAALRTREIDPFISECDRQFKIYSRLVSIQEQDLKMAGQYT